MENNGALTLVAVAAAISLATVACYEPDYYQQQQAEYQPGPQYDHHYRRSPEGPHYGRGVGPSFLSQMSDEDLLNELTLRRGLLAGAGYFDNRRVAGRRPRIGTPLHQQQQQQQQHQLQLPQQLIGSSSGASADTVSGLGAFEQSSAEVVGSAFDGEQEQDHAQVDTKKLEAARVKGIVSDKGAHAKKNVSLDSKNFGKEKHLRAGEDIEVHDRKSLVDADVLAAEKTRATRDKERTKVSSKAGAAKVNQAAGVVAGSASGAGANTSELVSE